MKKNIIFELLIILFILFPLFTFAQNANIGIIQGIWFSQEQVFADDPLRIYTAIQNNTGDDIQGTVEFFDNEISLGSKDFTVLNNRIQEVWFDTIVNEGSHDYSVAITQASINSPGESLKSITPRVIESGQTIVVLRDSDNDAIPDIEDSDDDNDGFSDVQEQLAGTNPLDKNSIPIDGLNTDNKTAEGSTLIQDLVNIFSSDDSVFEHNNFKNGENDITIPVVIQNAAKNYPIINSISEPVNKIQNIIVPIVSTEKEKNQRRRTQNEIKIIDGEMTDILNTDEVNLSEREIPTWKYWIYILYGLFLSVIEWLVSCLICMIILLFAMLYLLLKFIFRLFISKSNSSY